MGVCLCLCIPSRAKGPKARKMIDLPPRTRRGLFRYRYLLVLPVPSSIRPVVIAADPNTVFIHSFIHSVSTSRKLLSFYSNMTGTSVITPMEIDDPATTASKKKEASHSQLPWVEKYRPQRLEDLVAHEDIVNIITNLIDNDNLPHLLLYGPPGTGKTSTIVAAAKRMYGKAYGSMTLELNASDTRGIGVVRNEIKEFAGTQQLFNRGVKLIILDEADAMTNDAQFALRRVIEKYTRNARFCLICNYVSKIIPALQSRCTRFRFAPLMPSQIQGRLEEVAQAEGVKLTEDGTQAILRLSGGDMRRVLNLLQSTAMSNNTSDVLPAGKTSDELNETDVYLTSGAPLPQDVDRILDWLMNQSFGVAYENVVKLCSTKGYALTDVLQDLAVKVLTLELDSAPLGRLLDGMSNVENRLAAGTDEKIQTASLVGVFVQTRLTCKV